MRGGDRISIPAIHQYHSDARIVTASIVAQTSFRVVFILALVLLISIPGYGAHRNPPPAECPQPRFTGQAPAEIFALANPLEPSRRHRRAGRELYEELLQPACADCHGSKGEGNGPLADQFDPRPRNFACSETINGIPDGQLYWIVRNGSPGTARPPFDFLEEEEVWQLVLYLRSLADDH